MSTAAATNDLATARRDAFATRVLESAVAAFELFTMHIGDQLGYYDVLAAEGPLTPVQLAAHTGTNERYAREWLEQQAAAGILDVEDEAAAPHARRFRIPAGVDEVLAGRDSLNYMAPLGQAVAGAVQPLQMVIRAFRQGGGVPYEEYGRDAREGQARLNRAVCLNQLGQEWIPAMADVHQRLSSGTNARVADFGCGYGWSSIGIARVYPNVKVDGFDLDAESVQAAERNAREYGLDGRVRFWCRNAADPALDGRYDLVMALECLHDMSDPVGALGTMRRLMAPGGTVLIVDERNHDAFHANAGIVERLQYGFSVLHCLPVCMSEQPSAATGTVMRTTTFREYAREAGFKDVEVLPVENMLFRLYRLRE